MVEILVNEFWVQTLGKTRNFSNFGVKKLKLPSVLYAQQKELMSNMTKSSEV